MLFYIFSGPNCLKSYVQKIPQVKAGRRPGDAENQSALTEKALLELN